jgi:hypothetical protein
VVDESDDAGKDDEVEVEDGEDGEETDYGCNNEVDGDEEEAWLAAGEEKGGEGKARGADEEKREVEVRRLAAAASLRKLYASPMMGGDGAGTDDEEEKRDRRRAKGRGGGSKCETQHIPKVKRKHGSPVLSSSRRKRVTTPLGGRRFGYSQLGRPDS